MTSRTMMPRGNRVFTGGSEMSDVIQTSNQHRAPAYKVSFQIRNDIGVNDLFEDVGVYANVCVRDGTGGLIYQSKTTVVEVDHGSSVVEYYIVASDIEEYMSELAVYLNELDYYIGETNRVEIVDGGHIPPDRRHIQSTRFGGAYGY
jgi:hypothetical protein